VRKVGRRHAGRANGWLSRRPVVRCERKPDYGCGEGDRAAPPAELRQPRKRGDGRRPQGVYGALDRDAQLSNQLEFGSDGVRVPGERKRFSAYGGKINIAAFSRRPRVKPRPRNQRLHANPARYRVFSFSARFTLRLSWLFPRHYP